MADDIDRLIKLIEMTETALYSWVKFLMTVEAGLVVILGFILRPSQSGEQLDAGLRLAASIAVPLLGITFAIVIGCLIVRERQWAGWYVARIKDPSLSPTVMPQVGQITSQPIGWTGRVVVSLSILLVLGWILVFVALKP